MTTIKSRLLEVRIVLEYYSKPDREYIVSGKPAKIAISVLDSVIADLDNNAVTAGADKASYDVLIAGSIPAPAPIICVACGRYIKNCECVIMGETTTREDVDDNAKMSEVSLVNVVETAIDPECNCWWASDAAKRVVEAIKPYLRTTEGEHGR